MRKGKFKIMYWKVIVKLSGRFCKVVTYAWEPLDYVQALTHSCCICCFF
jgi:hypothetical protein